MRVDVNLYALVFGESVLNDAVAIVLSGYVDIDLIHVESYACDDKIYFFMCIVHKFLIFNKIIFILGQFKITENIILRLEILRLMHF